MSKSKGQEFDVPYEDTVFSLLFNCGPVELSRFYFRYFIKCVKNVFHFHFVLWQWVFQTSVLLLLGLRN